MAAGEEVGKTNKTTLLLTMDWESLRDGLGAATTLGGLDAGTHLAPETVRRLCCDGSVIPVVLGGRGEVMDWGLEKRFFTDAQTKRLWLRDGGCTYPGCDAPPQWTDAHHLIHWADLGPSDLDNAALLCDRHHTTVHNRRYAGRVVRDGTGNGSSGTSPAAPTTNCSPGVPPRNQRDPAPHPADHRWGRRHGRAGGMVGPEAWSGRSLGMSRSGYGTAVLIGGVSTRRLLLPDCIALTRNGAGDVASTDNRGIRVGSRRG